MTDKEWCIYHHWLWKYPIFYWQVCSDGSLMVIIIMLYDGWYSSTTPSDSLVWCIASFRRSRLRLRRRPWFPRLGGIHKNNPSIQELGIHSFSGLHRFFNARVSYETKPLRSSWGPISHNFGWHHNQTQKAIQTSKKSRLTKTRNANYKSRRGKFSFYHQQSGRTEKTPL